jgi:hypothetical protein
VSHWYPASWFFFCGTEVLNSGLCTCKAGALSLQPHLQSIFHWLLWRLGSGKLLSRLTPQTSIFPISASQVGRIQAWATCSILYDHDFEFTLPVQS